MRIRPASLLPLALGALAGCSPQDGEVTGSYALYMAAESSQNIEELKARRVPFNSDDAGERADAYDNLGMYPVDCRPLDDEAARLADADYADCTRDPNWYGWLDDFSYYVKEGELKPYRVEAVITSEHDIQLTAHIDIPKFGDFRFGWVIDPDFQPQVCVDKADNSGAELVPVDGDWLGGWSEGVDGTLFHLNAFSYQLNPANHQDYWTIDQTWMAGYTFGRFAEEEFYGRSTDYIQTVDPTVYGWPLYLLDYSTDTFRGQYGNNQDNWPPTLPFADDYGYDYQAWFDAMGPALNDDHDLAALGGAAFPHEFKLENNAWRISEEEAGDEQSENFAYGLENWIGVSSSWVQLEATPDELAALEAGKLDKPLKGTFQVHSENLDSASKLFVSGSFTIDHLRKDIWGYDPTLEEQKKEENDTPECGEERLTTGDEG